MKTFTRIEKTRFIEKIKTLLIVGLLFLCLFFGYRILRLYRAQANIDSVLRGGLYTGTADIWNSGNYTLNIMSELPQPNAIIVNGSQGRTLLADKEDEAFDSISDFANQILAELYGLKNDEVMTSSKEEWENAVKLNSIYIKYPVERFLNFESSLYEAKGSGLSNKIKSYTSILVVPSVDGEQAVTVFIAEQNGDTVVKAELKTDIAKAVAEGIKKLDDNSKKDYAFACELNLDEASGRDKVVFDSMMLIPGTDEKAYEIKVTTPKIYKTGLSFTKVTDLTVGLINTFGYNPNTIRQYVNSDDSLMFVGETGSLSLHPKGLIEYKALDAEDGIPLDKTGGGDLKKSLYGLCEMIERVMKISGININNADFTVKLTNMPVDYKAISKTEIGFDYFIKDKKLEFLDTYGVWAVLQKGNLVELKMQLKDIEKQNKQSLMGGMLDEIDKFCAENKDCKKINSVYGVYRYEEDTAELKAEWKVEGAK